MLSTTQLGVFSSTASNVLGAILRNRRSRLSEVAIDVTDDLRTTMMSLSSSKAGVFEIKWLIYSRRFKACQQKCLNKYSCSCCKTLTMKIPKRSKPETRLLIETLREPQSCFKFSDGRSVNIC